MPALTPPSTPRPMRRVGHKGADHIAPGNTPASFDAALTHDVDMIEFDVLPEHLDGTGELFLAHDPDALRTARAEGRAITLDEGLDHLCGTGFSAVELDVDLKLPGYEARVIAALRDRGLEERSLISTMETGSLPVLRAASDVVRIGWSVPKLRRNPLTHPLTKLPALVGLQVLRRTIPRAVGAAIREGRVDAAMAHWALVTPYFAHTVREAGGDLYVWTVDDAARIAKLEAMGVTGVITNDPRLFGPRA